MSGLKIFIACVISLIVTLKISAQGGNCSPSPLPDNACITDNSIFLKDEKVIEHSEGIGIAAGNESPGGTQTQIRINEGDEITIDQPRGELRFIRNDTLIRTDVNGMDGLDKADSHGVLPSYRFSKFKQYAVVIIVGEHDTLPLGNRFHIIATRAMTISLAINDAPGFYRYYEGFFGYSVKILHRIDAPCRIKTYPQAGDVSNMRFYQQPKGSYWCWAAVAQIMMQQASNDNHCQCEQIIRTDPANMFFDVCGNPKKWYDVAKTPEVSYDFYGYTYQTKLVYKNQTFTQEEMARVLSANHPIQLLILQISTKATHMEVIYGYSMVGSKMYLRIFDPQATKCKYCEPFENLNGLIADGQFKILKYTYNVQKK